MFQAVAVKIALRDEDDLRLFEGDPGGGVEASIEDRNFGNGFARQIDGQHLLAAAGGTLEDAHLAAGDNVQSVAGLALAEEQLARAEALARGPGRQGAQLLRGEAGEQGRAP